MLNKRFVKVGKQNQIIFCEQKSQLKIDN